MENEAIDYQNKSSDLVAAAEEILPGTRTLDLAVFDLPVLRNRVIRALMAERAKERKRAANLVRNRRPHRESTALAILSDDP